MKQKEIPKTIDDWRNPLHATPSEIAAHKAKYIRVNKLEIVEYFGKALGYGQELTDYWMRAGRNSPDAEAFFAACGEAYSVEIFGAVWLSILEDWYVHDWRGKKEQAPTPFQLFEHGLKWLARVRDEVANRDMLHSGTARVVEPPPNNTWSRKHNRYLSDEEVSLEL